MTDSELKKKIEFKQGLLQKEIFAGSGKQPVNPYTANSNKAKAFDLGVIEKTTVKEIE